MASSYYEEPFLKSPSCIMIVGPSQCGKTTFTRQLLHHAARLFDRPPKHIVYCYGASQPCFEDMKKQGIHFHEGLPTDIETLFPAHKRPGLLILDDLMRTCSQDEEVVDLFTKRSHHNDVTCIYLAQNVFPPGKFARTISLNVHYLVAFKNPRDALGIRNLAQQSYPDRVKYIMECYRNATSTPYGYLLFDLHPSTQDDLRIRTNILSDYPIVYQQDEHNK